MGVKTERIDEWSSTDSIALAPIYRRLVEELKKRCPSLIGNTIETTAMSAREIKGFNQCLEAIEILSFERPVENLDAGFTDMSTNSDNEQNPLN